jgi:hypothetical protein
MGQKDLEALKPHPPEYAANMPHQRLRRRRRA